MTTKKKRLLLVLPVLVIPFAVFGFWVWKNGKRETEKDSGKRIGINTSLPDPKLDKDPLTKLAFYERVAADSARTRERSKHDPYLVKDSAAEKKAIAQLDALDHVLREQPVPVVSKNKVVTHDVVRHGDVERLEQLMHHMKENPVHDPEISQLDSLMDKIIAVQYPEKIKNEIGGTSRAVLTVKGCTAGDDAFADESAKVFNEFGDTLGLSENPVITAIIEKNQSIVPGSVVMLRLNEPVRAGDVMIPKGHLLSGISSLNGERLQINIASIYCNGQWLPVALQAMDLDGIAGIYVPNAMIHASLKQSGMRSLSSAGIGNLGQHAAAQLATAGIEAGKNLLTKRARQQRIKLPAGYQVLLMNHTNQ